MVTDLKQMKQEQLWHQIKNTSVGLDFMEQMCFGIVLQKNLIVLQKNKAAELDGSARMWLRTPQQTQTEALTFLAKNQQLSNAMLMGK